ncbi:MAG: isoprenoid biosynthesis protein ElbB [Candidatus Cloacimonadota bacterium]|nr:MAG: isoprenoid biosynthesis protein ElbB [Candidatus Cloacimonadota bacterium]
MGKIAVILSGCGVFDGSEIHEAVLTLLALDQRNQEVHILAPNIDQHHVINHQNGEEMNEKRNVLIESARIARGAVTSLSESDPSQFDAIILPGGFGAAKNLSNFAFIGSKALVLEELSNFLLEFKKYNRPIGAICISPVLLALLNKELGNNSKLSLTIGNDEDTSEALKILGCNHESKSVHEICVDTTHKIVTTPAYMVGQNISDVHKGIDALVEKVISMI